MTPKRKDSDPGDRPAQEVPRPRPVSNGITSRSIMQPAGIGKAPPGTVYKIVRVVRGFNLKKSHEPEVYCDHIAMAS
jgi:hypothetical protein